MITIFKHEYHGFEDAFDIDRDISEMWQSDEAKKMPGGGEWRGKLTITVTYEPPSEDDEAAE